VEFVERRGETVTTETEDSEMPTPEPISLTRDVEAVQVPTGEKVLLRQGQQADIFQALGDAFTVVVNGNTYRIEGKDADALGRQPPSTPAATPTPKTGPAQPLTQEELEKQAWDALRNCYDPEIPVNVVDLGLIYDLVLTKLGENSFRADVKMTLTAPGCAMGPMIAQDVQNRLLSLPGIEEANVELVWDPPWNQAMMSEAAKLQLGLL
jgi:probable FeS assembly SUF system protein SufT